jgi:hypothetical protein
MFTPVASVVCYDRFIQRTALLWTWAVLLILAPQLHAAGPADEDLGPPGYKSDARQPYKHLLEAKIQWLKGKIANHQHLIDILCRQLPNSGTDQQETIQERVKAHQQAIDEAKAELKVLGGKDVQAQKKLVKKNVEAWIHALKAKAADYRDRAAKEAQAAKDANNKQDADRHRAEAKDDTKEELDAEQTAAHLADDLAHAKL